MNIRRSIMGLVGAALAMMACSSTAETGNQNGDGGGGAGAGGGDGGGGGVAEPVLADTCGSMSACKDGSAQRIEGGDAFAMYGMDCIVEALRDRTAGTYYVELDHTWGNGQSVQDLVYVVTPSGALEIERVLKLDGEGETTETVGPVMRCDLETEAFFDSCLTAVSEGDGKDASDAAWECVYPNVDGLPPWTTNCVEQAPTCQ